jgi:hemolysin III
VLERPGDAISGLTHLLAAVAAVLGLGALLYVGRTSPVKEATLFVYGSSLVLMFATSSAYHLLKSRPLTARRLRKLDHAAIYVLIAGSYTPLCLHFFRGFWRWGLPGIVWSIAVVGVAVKLSIVNVPRWISTGVYVLMGWLAVLAIREMLLTMSGPALMWLVAGGLFFTVGAVVYATKKPDICPGVFGFHELWHVFVILGCLCHFILIAWFVAPSSAALVR